MSFRASWDFSMGIEPSRIHLMIYLRECTKTSIHIGIVFYHISGLILEDIFILVFVLKNLSEVCIIDFEIYHQVCVIVYRFELLSLEPSIETAFRIPRSLNRILVVLFLDSSTVCPG